MGHDGGPHVPWLALSDALEPLRIRTGYPVLDNSEHERGHAGSRLHSLKPGLIRYEALRNRAERIFTAAQRLAFAAFSFTMSVIVSPRQKRSRHGGKPLFGVGLTRIVIPCRHDHELIAERLFDM